MKIKIIAAIAKDNSIGTKENTIPWNFHLKDMEIFKTKTKSENGIVIMGKNTFFSLPENLRPLKDRRNIIISSDKSLKIDGAEIFESPEKVLEELKNENTIWILGGGSIYREFIKYADELHISHFEIEPNNAEIFFPEIDSKIWQEIENTDFEQTETSPKFSHKVYIRKN
jgi:dihydrofolate reductase